MMKKTNQLNTDNDNDKNNDNNTTGFLYSYYLLYICIHPWSQHAAQFQFSSMSKYPFHDEDASRQDYGGFNHSFNPNLKPNSNPSPNPNPNPSPSPNFNYNPIPNPSTNP